MEPIFGKAWKKRLGQQNVTQVDRLAEVYQELPLSKLRTSPTSQVLLMVCAWQPVEKFTPLMLGLAHAVYDYDRTEVVEQTLQRGS